MFGVTLAPTATKIPAEAQENVLVCGSHGGTYAGYLVARAGVRAVVLNDAGVGLDEAGIATLAYGDALGMAVATVAHSSARIGDAEDMLARGIISYANVAAAATGVVAGMACEQACSCLRNAPLPRGEPAAYEEARSVLGVNAHGLGIVCVDSASLVSKDDVGQVVLTGSHGGVVAGQRGLAIRSAVAAAFYNDAGVGIDEAGVSRLPVLDERGIAAATVAATSARIGDARSSYETGILSRVNESAERLGLVSEMSAREAVEQVTGATPAI